MFTRTHTSVLTLAAVAMATLAFTAQAVTAAVIYSDSFTRTGDLNGTAPDVAPGAETWTSTNWETTGTVSSASSNGAAGYLPFAPSAGTVYTLSADIDVTSTTHAQHFYGIGFTTAIHANPFENPVPAYLFEGGSNGWDAFAAANNGGVGNVAQGTAPAGAVTYAIELDTTAAAWTAKFFVNGGEVASHTYVTNPTINYVALGDWHAESGGTDGSLDNFTLSQVTVPAPAALPAGLGILGLIALRRRRKA